MKIAASAFAMVALALFGSTLARSARACGFDDIIEILAAEAIIPDADRATRAIGVLRALGPVSLVALREIYQAQIQEASGADDAAAAFRASAEWTRIARALDGVSRMKDCYAAGLYWYTDWNSASGAARLAGRPILTLRLLGNLDEELSCANSRYFRTVLYADPQIAAYLRDNYVLHWQSVRPVPRITIDFGDGRMLERTITGNSVHYVVDADGGVLDALPGLLAPASFLEMVAAARDTFAIARVQEHAQQAALIRSRFWERTLASIVQRREAEFAAVSFGTSRLESSAAPVGAGISAGQVRAAQPVVVPALAAAPRARAKMQDERPTLESLASRIERMAVAADDARWQQIAARREPRVEISASARSLMRSKCGATSDFPAKLAAFRRALAADTVYNELELRLQALRWLVEESKQTPLDAPRVDVLNARVYAELFKTPDADPWLGLAPPDAYSAIANEGVVVRK